MKRPPTSRPNNRRLLLVIRHGQAVPRNAGLSDLERSLTTTGALACRQVASSVADRKLIIDLMISSPADRSLETAHLFSERLGYPTRKIQIDTILYEAESAAALIELLRCLPDTAHIVALCGHNPSLEVLVGSLVRGFTRTLAKGATAAISLPIEAWAEIEEGVGAMEFFITPGRHTGKTAKASGGAGHRRTADKHLLKEIED